MKELVEVVFQPDGRRGEFNCDTSVLAAAQQLGVEVTSICGGHGRCGKCKVIVEDGARVDPPTENELRLLTAGGLQNGYRLACETKVTDDVIVTIPAESRIGRQRLQVEGIGRSVELAPTVRKVVAEVPPPSLTDLRSDAKRLLDALALANQLGDVCIEYDTVKTLPSTLRNGAWTVTALISNERKIIDLDPGITLDEPYGVAIDVGTTKIATYLVNLANGSLIAECTLPNPQISYGEDIISRLAYAHTEEGLTKLNDAIRQAVNRSIEKVCGGTVPTHRIYEAVAVGNTVMHHLFLRIDPRPLARSPFPPAIKSRIDVRPSELGITINQNGNVHLPPLIAGFIGSDCVAGILATGLHETDRMSLLVDIGTNTEIVLGNRDGMYACSCASGPAFEGAHIKYGMRAATGAIESVTIDHDTYEVYYRVIDDEPPKGLCGSAMVDVLAELLKTRLMDTGGRIIRETGNPRVREVNGTLELVLVEERTGTSKVVVTQQDVRELQKAKAAISAGTSILMRWAGVDRTEIETMFVAGAFGTYIDPWNAQLIGLFPELKLRELSNVGNAAGAGARMVLQSSEARDTATRIPEMVEYIELATDHDFQNEYLSATYFPHRDLTRYPRTIEAHKLRLSRGHENLGKMVR
jgi:uncharacterized 2Fe-2S/4Fe-4S cluster protein (DUF4445 family)